MADQPQVNSIPPVAEPRRPKKLFPNFERRLEYTLFIALRLFFVSLILCGVTMLVYLMISLWSFSANWRSEQVSQAQATNIIYVARAKREAKLITDGKLNFNLISCSGAQCAVAPTTSDLSGEGNGQ